MASECEGIDEPDVCELSAKFLDCMNKAAVKLNLFPGEVSMKDWMTRKWMKLEKCV